MPLSPAVRRYAEQSRNVAIGRDFVSNDGFQLGRWADRQRIARVIRSLPPQREHELNAIGFDWQVEPIPQSDAKRLLMLTELAAYREAHGTSEVPVHYVTDNGDRLGEWLYRQIKRWRTGKLPETEQAVLSLFGVSPGARRRGPRTTANPT
ncbi:helicase associated domain-containing protein [Rhodococcus sp. NPDC003318]|uniref:helicase associated domain-containing protein n=1 Tax=Rhodococcus sp. NPDC003318 TaxID=3364503 RepID=UPI0036C75BC2